MDTQLDPQVLALTKAIRQAESGGNFNARSKDGSFGAYQFIKPTWEAAAKKFGVNAPWEKATPAQQNEVAYKQVKEWKDKGYNVGEIASMWNAGAGRPNAYKENLVGTNKDGVKFNTPKYAEKVATFYHQFKQGSGPAPTPAPEPETGPFKYSTLPTVEDRAAKIANLKSEAAIADEEARKANTLGGKAKAFGGALVKNLFGSEVGLGHTLGESLAAGDVAENLNQANEATADVRVNMIKTIRAKKERGEDTSRLERVYNETYGSTNPLPSFADILPATQKTNAQVLGELGGTALDVLSAGTYGKSTKVMQTGKLATKTNAVVGNTIASHMKSTDQIIKNLPADELAKLGGTPELLKRTSTNIVDQLRKQGMNSAANTIAKINPANFASFAEYTAAITKAVPSLSKVTTTASVLFPELGKISRQTASGLFTRKGAANVAKGGLVGYAYDVSEGAQGRRGEDREGAKAFIPGVGTALGAGIPAVSETVQSFKNKFDPGTKAARLAQQRRTELDKLDRLSTVSKAAEKAKERGIDVKQILSETDVLHGAVDNTGKITTRGEGAAMDLYTREFINGNEGIVSQALKKENKSIAATQVEKKLMQAIDESGIEGEALIQAQNKVKRELAGYLKRSTSDGTIPLVTLHDAKIDKYSNINFNTDLQKAKYDKAVAKALKELVEENSTSIDVKAVNKELSKHFAVLGYLEKLDGKTVQGGKLGKYFAQTVGAIVGSQAGGAIGGILGAEAGSRIKGNIMEQAFRGKTGKVQPQAEAITDAIRYRDSEPLLLGDQSSNSLGNRNSNQTTTITPTMNGIPDSIPPKEGFLEAAKKNVEIEPLIQEAKKYKSAEEFVKAISPSYSKLPDSPLYHGTSANIKNGKLTFGVGDGAKKGGQSGGHFLSDSKQISETFAGNNGKVYIVDPSYKKSILDLTKPKGVKEVENYIGNKYKTYDGEILEFTRDDFETMFPGGKTDFASISQYPELIEQITKRKGYKGIAFDEYAGGKTGKTYQILHSDNIPVIEQKKISDSELSKLIKEKTDLEPKATDLRLEEYGRNQDGYLTDSQINELYYLEKRMKEIDNILISSDYKSQLEEIWKKAKRNLKSRGNSQGGFIKNPFYREGPKTQRQTTTKQSVSATKSNANIPQSVTQQYKKIAKLIDMTDRNVLLAFSDAVGTGAKLDKDLAQRMQDLADQMKLPNRFNGNKSLLKDVNAILDIDRANTKANISKK